jgi:hypothetical protein
MTFTILIGIVCIWNTPLWGAVPETPTIGLVSGSPFYEVGAVVTVDLEIAAVTDLYAIAADITYDSTLLTFIDAADLQVYGAQGTKPAGLLVTDKPAEGRLVLGLSYLGEGHWFDATDSVVLVRITFVAAQSGVATLDFENLGLLEEDGTPIVTLSSSVTFQVLDHALYPDTAAADELALQTRLFSVNSVLSLTTVSAGQAFTIDIQISNLQNVRSFVGDIAYNTAKMAIDRVENHAVFDIDGTVKTTYMLDHDHDAGTIVFGISQIDDGHDLTYLGAKTALTLHCRALETGLATTSLSNIGLISPNGYGYYNTTVSGATVTIIDPIPAAELTAGPEVVETISGNPTTVTLTCGTVQDLFAFAADFTFDPTLLECIDVSEGTLLNEEGVSTTALQADIDNIEGRVIVGMTRLDAGAPGVTSAAPMPLVSLTFMPLQSGDTQVVMDNIGLLRNDGVSEIAFTKTTADPTIFIYPGPYGLYGDVNNNWIVNSVDGLIILSDAVGIDMSAFQPFLSMRGDINEDIERTVADALACVQFWLNPLDEGLPPLIGTELGGGELVVKPASPVPGETSRVDAPRAHLTTVVETQEDGLVFIRPVIGTQDGSTVIAGGDVSITWEPGVCDYVRVDRGTVISSVNDSGVETGSIRYAAMDVTGAPEFRLPVLVLREHVSGGAGTVTVTLNEAVAENCMALVIESGDISVSVREDMHDMPSGFMLNQNVPNPFNALTRIAFRLDDAGPATIEVFSMSGQRVAVLADGWFGAGIQEVVWDGRDATGAGVASGVYVYRMTSHAGIDNKRMLYLK